MRRSLIAAVFLTLSFAAAASAQPLVFLVRHAERADAGMASAKTPGADPELSDAGRTRAAALSATLKDARISAIFTTEYKRTRETAQPVARTLELTPVTVPSKDSADLVARVKAARGNVLIVGHSNTLPEIIKLLGVSESVQMSDEDYDSLFVVVRGDAPSLVRMHYR